MKTIENTNTRGLVKYRNLLGRMYEDFDVLPIGNIPKKYLDEVHQQVVIELVKDDCYVVISKIAFVYSQMKISVWKCYMILRSYCMSSISSLYLDIKQKTKNTGNCQSQQNMVKHSEQKLEQLTNLIQCH